MDQPSETADAITRTCRSEHGRVMAALVGWCGDFQAAEDGLQDAYASALETWPETGTPANPAAWLTTVARRRIVDKKRRASTWRTKEELLAAEMALQEPAEIEDLEQIPDERLRLIFTCCHPAIARRDRVALTLRTLGGLTTDELARAFLVKSATMAQRLVRVQRKILKAGIPYKVPDADERKERLNGVLSVLYLIFNEGYSASAGEELLRVDLCKEAIRLGSLLVELMPDEPEIRGLLALMLFHHARSEARVSKDGQLIPLDEQDRDLWCQKTIDLATYQLAHAMDVGEPGKYQLQAAISALHCRAPSWGETDFRQIVGLYTALYRFQPSPVVALNRAVAVADAEGAEAGLRILEALEHGGTLDEYQPFHAARAELLRRTERFEDSRKAYQKAVELSENDREREFLEQRLARLKTSF